MRLRLFVNCPRLREQYKKQPCAGNAKYPGDNLAVERRVREVDVVFLRHPVFGKPETFAEPLEVYDLPRTEEADDVVHVRIVAEAEDIVVGNAGLLLCCVLVRTISPVCPLNRMYFSTYSCIFPAAAVYCFAAA